MASVRKRLGIGEAPLIAVAGGVAIVAMWIGVARADAQAPPEPPTEAIVWWRFDPSGFASTRGGGEAGARLFAGGLRAAVAAGLLGDGTALAAGQAMVGGLELGRAPHLAVITDFEATRGFLGQGMEVRRLRGWAELRTAEDHASMLRTIRALGVVSPGKGEANGAQRVVRLDDGGQAVVYRRSDWPEWAELGWASREGRFAVGVGEGAMREWAAHGGAAPEDEAPPWRAHRRAVERSDEFFELWIDLTELRARFPAAFVSGRTPRMLDALGLGGAQRVMVHGRFAEAGGAAANAPPLLEAVVTIEPAEGPLEVRRLTSRDRPGGLAAALAQRGSYVVSLDRPVSELLGFGLGVYEATVPDDELAAFRSARASYERERSAELARLDEAMGGGVSLTDWPTPPAPIPGLCTVVAELGGGVGAGEADALLRGLLEPFDDRVDRRARAGGMGWSLRLDEGGLIRFPVWGLVQNGRHAALVGGWGEPVLEAAWRTLDRLRPEVGGGGSDQSNR